MEGVDAGVVDAEHALDLVVDALVQGDAHGAGVVPGRFGLGGGQVFAVGRGDARRKAAAHLLGQRSVQRNQILLVHMVGRGQDVMGQGTVIGQQYKAGAGLIQAARREQLPPGVVRGHQVHHSGIPLVAAGADDALRLIEHDIHILFIFACQRRAVQRDLRGGLVQLGIRLAADLARDHHAPLGDGLAAFAAGHAGALGQVLIQPHHVWCSWVMAAVLPRVTLIRSAGAHSTWVPMRPPETMMVGWARQLSS